MHKDYSKIGLYPHNIDGYKKLLKLIKITQLSQLFVPLALVKHILVYN